MLDEHALHSHTVLSEEEIAELTSPDGKIYMTVPPPRLRVTRSPIAKSILRKVRFVWRAKRGRRE